MKFVVNRLIQSDDPTHRLDGFWICRQIPEEALSSQVLFLKLEILISRYKLTCIDVIYKF